MRLWIALIAALASFAATATAQEKKPFRVVHYKSIGGWDVQYDESYKNGCAIFSKSPGPKLRLGYDDNRALYAALENDAWRSLEAGKRYPMAIHIDDRQHPGEMEAMRIPNGSIVLIRRFKDPLAGRQFLEDFQRGNRMTVHYEGRQLVTYTLYASGVAGDELQRCQAVQDAKPAEDPFSRKTAGTGPATSAPPTGSNPPSATTLPKLTADQRIDAVRLAANLLTRMPGFRILNEEEQEKFNPTVAKMQPAVVWRTEGAVGLLHLLPDKTEAEIPKISLFIAGGIVQQCDTSEFSASMAPDVRSPTTRRIEITCFEGNKGIVMRLIIMPVKGGVYYFSTVAELKDKAAGARADEALRNALFEVVKN